MKTLFHADCLHTYEEGDILDVEDAKLFMSNNSGGDKSDWCGVRVPKTLLKVGHTPLWFCNRLPHNETTPHVATGRLKSDGKEEKQKVCYIWGGPEPTVDPHKVIEDIKCALSQIQT